jgi:hypothetical protein
MAYIINSKKMLLNSKSYFAHIIFSFFGISFTVFWITIFTIDIIIGSDFSLTHLVLIPVLIIPIWMIYILQHHLDRLRFTKDGVTIYKILFLKYKFITWTSIDYGFHTIETGRNRSCRVMYLVRNKRLVLRISDYDYKNYDDIINYVTSSIENKGFIELNYFDSFKYLTQGVIHKLP